MDDGGAGITPLYLFVAGPLATERQRLHACPARVVASLGRLQKRAPPWPGTELFG